MADGEQFRERYRSGDTPRDAGQPDFNLIEVVTGNPIRSCKVLEVGCGTGDNSVWLAQNHFQVVGVGISGFRVQRSGFRPAFGWVKPSEALS